MTIAENLPRLRRDKGMSQTALAKKAGVSQQLISRLESGADQTSKKLPDLARALGVSVYEIDEAYKPEISTDPVRTVAEVREFLLRIPNLTPEKAEIVIGVIDGYAPLIADQSKRTVDHDQPELSSPHRELTPSR